MSEETVYYNYEWYIVETGEVFYIGKGKGNRYKQTNHRNKFFKDMYNSHICDVRIVANNLTEKEAFDNEKELIKYYRENTSYRLTNQTDGGEGASGYRYSEEQRQRIALTNKETWKNEEYRQRMLIIFKETCQREDYKNKQSIIMKERWQDEEYRKKMIKTSKEYWNSEEGKQLSSQRSKALWEDPKYKQLLIEKRTGENNGMFGKHHTQETKEKISEALNGKYSGENSCWFGRKQSEEHKRKHSESVKGKYTGEDNHSSKLTNIQCENLKLDYINSFSIEYLEEKYNIKKSSIYKILRGESYPNIRKDLNNEIKILLEKNKQIKKDNKAFKYKSILNLYNQGYNCNEISKKLNLKYKYVSQALCDMKKDGIINS